MTAYEVARRHRGVRTVVWRGESLDDGEGEFLRQLGKAREDRFDGYLVLVDRDTDELQSWAMLDGGVPSWGLWRCSSSAPTARTAPWGASGSRTSPGPSA